MIEITLPFPPSELSGHNTGHWAIKGDIIKKHRDWAFQLTKAARPVVPAKGDIAIHFAFYPPDKRSDRMNFANRIKPYADGIADALQVNDSRFLPSYSFHDVTASGAVKVRIG